MYMELPLLPPLGTARAYAFATSVTCSRAANKIARSVTILCPLCGAGHVHSWDLPPVGHPDAHPGIRSAACAAYLSGGEYVVVVPRVLWMGYAE